MNRQRAISLLNLSKEWTKQDVRRAYKRRALELHPDRKQGMASQFIELKEAHDFLLNSQNKSCHHIDIHKDIERLIDTLTQQYKDAIAPFILALPKEKQQWMIHFLEMYGKFILGEEECDTILHKIQKEYFNNKQELSNEFQDSSEESILIYIDEMIRDQVIIQHDEYIPSWVLVWNDIPIHRDTVNGIHLDESNQLTFIIERPIQNIYHANETIQLNRSYFSGSNMIHIMCSIQKSDLRITPDIQYPRFEMKCFTIYNSEGKVIWTHRENDFKGCIHPSVSLDDIQIRTPYRVGVQLTL